MLQTLCVDPAYYEIVVLKEEYHFGCVQSGEVQPNVSQAKSK